MSHMGEIEIRGEGALDLCQQLSANDVARMKAFQAQYNLAAAMKTAVSSTTSSFIACRPASIFICVNASNSG